MSCKLTFSAFLLCVAAASVAGCGRSDIPELGTVTGTVMLNNQPLADAIVSFTPQESGRPSSAQTDATGRYSLIYVADVDGAIVGKHSVTVRRVLTAADDDLPDDPADLEEGQVMIEELPASASDGSIIKEVTAGSNSIDIALAG
jgi:hypothetical protein